MITFFALVCRRLFVLVLLGLMLSAAAQAEEAPSSKAEADHTKFSPADLEFFEKQVRPLLSKRCFECHQKDSEELGGNLRLDSRAMILQGGDTGAAIVPKHPGESLMIQSVKYEGDYEMPPDSKLPAEEIAVLTKWIELGAPWPAEQLSQAELSGRAFPLQERKESHWCWSPITRAEIPKVKQKTWPRGDVDHFILSKLEAKGLAPAAPADRHNWIRRVTQDITGLPPSRSEVESFVADTSDDAYEKVVDRLLASPRYGEHWAKHWMDLVRYAETKAYETDYTMPYVYRYRDYLIRAMNIDVPYDQFVREAVAGDLLEKPRRNPKDDSNESIIGPGYQHLTEGHHGPPDIHGDQARIFESVIDVNSKTFLGITLACARCHDHKFDAITTKDYYSLYGVIRSSRFEYPNIVSLEKRLAWRKKLTAQKQLVKQELIEASRTVLRYGVDWAGLFGKDKKELAASDPLNPLAELLMSGADDNQREIAWNKLKARAAKPLPVEPEGLGGLSGEGLGQWTVTGTSFGNATRLPGDFIVGRQGTQAIAAFVGSSASAGRLSSRFAGSLKSPSFRVPDQIRVRVKGRHARVRLYIEHYEMVGLGPTTSKLDVQVMKDDWHWISFDTRLWVGTRAYLEVLHNGDEMGFTSNGQHRPVHSDDSYVAVDRVLLGSDAKITSRGPGDYAAAWDFPNEVPSDQDRLDHWMTERIGRLLDSWEYNTLSANEEDLLAALLMRETPLKITQDSARMVRSRVEKYRRMTTGVPKPVYVRSLSEGESVDEYVYIRGNHKVQSKEPARRHFLEAVEPQVFATAGSGRREWAEAIVDEANPLTSRVVVNRIWYRLFGQGIVASVDNFGKLGNEPSHPKLLDYLASEFMQNGWSRKKMIRALVLSNTYRMGSTPSDRAMAIDPGNVFLQRMPVKRLEAEVIRDAILSASGRLQHKMYGPSVPVSLEQATPSRSIPKKSGPLDGEGRRTVYQEWRRNYLPGFLQAFDLHGFSETVGRRNVTNVPAQSLALMNDPFVIQQAEVWAKRLLASKDLSVDDRLKQVHYDAFGRTATAKEIASGRAMLQDLGKEQGLSEESAFVEADVWKDFCHVMMNRKEFIFLY